MGAFSHTDNLPFILLREIASGNGCHHNYVASDKGSGIIVKSGENFVMNPCRIAVFLVT